jgi:hypothetical protein
LKGARYPYRDLLNKIEIGGWKVAQQWADQWRQSMPPTVPPVSASAKVRDVLNAAWRARLDGDTRLDAIAEVAQKTCEKIIDQKPKVPRRTDRARGQGPPPQRQKAQTSE